MDKNEQKDPSVLEVNVSEEVGAGEVIGDGKDEKLPALMRYVKWDGQVARRVTDDDIPRLVKEAAILGELCHTKTGAYSGANAVAHNQIDNEDPLRFFVSSSGEIIVNPVIIKHTKTSVDSIEACTSFAEEPPKTVQRYHVITVRYQTITTDKKLSEVHEDRFSGPDAKVFQHEVAHLNGHCIFDENASPEDAIGETLLTPSQELTDNKD